MKILIVGGGIGGLALASLLQNDKRFDITLIEQAPQITNIGFGLTLWGCGRNILRHVGVDSTLEKKGYKVPWVAIKDADGNDLQKLSLDQFRSYGGDMIIVHRSDLHQLLFDSVSQNKASIRLGVTVTNLVQHDRYVQVEFSDSSKDRFDIVVGADGIHSSVRKFVFGDEPKASGWSVRLFWLREGVRAPEGVLMLSGVKKMFAFYPCIDKVFGAVYEYNPLQKETSSNSCDLEKFNHCLKGYGFLEEEIQTCFTNNGVDHWSDHLVSVDMNAWAKNRVVLLGDSQHALSPVTGFGGSMALEDAFVLSEELIQAGIFHPSLFTRYSSRRNRRLQKVRSLSHFVQLGINITNSFSYTTRNVMARLLPDMVVEKKVHGLLKISV